MNRRQVWCVIFLWAATLSVAVWGINKAARLARYEPIGSGTFAGLGVLVWDREGQRVVLAPLTREIIGQSER